MAKLYKPIVAFIFLLSITLLLLSRVESNFNYGSDKVVFSEPVSNIIALQAMAGFVPGLSADFQILNVFSVSDAISRTGKDEYAPLMATYLNNASLLDPRFFDTYRLASSILVYDANLPLEGVQLLDYGSLVLEGSWELPFLGGFIAHEQLHDDEKAFKLMSRVLNRPLAPQLAINLATKYLNQTQTKDDVLVFLKYLMQTMPEKYRKGLEDKIRSLDENQGKN